jgi:hypothetical protein
MVLHCFLRKYPSQTRLPSIGSECRQEIPSLSHVRGQVYRRKTALGKEVERVQPMFVPELALRVVSSAIATKLFELNRLEYIGVKLLGRKIRLMSAVRRALFFLRAKPLSSTKHHSGRFRALIVGSSKIAQT